MIVPRELQPPPLLQQPTYQYPQVQIVIGSDGVYSPQGQHQKYYTPQPVQQVQPARSSCISFLVFAIVLLAIAGGIFTYIASSTPFFVDNLFGGGFARLEQTYGSDSTAVAKGTSIGAVEDAVDVALDVDGNVYVVNYDGWVLRFAPDGTALGEWKVQGDDPHPDSIAVDGVGNVYLTLATQLHKYVGATGAEISTVTVPDIFGMSDIALAPDGSVLSFLGGQSDQIIRYSPQGMEAARYQHPITEYDAEATIAPWLIHIATDTEGKIYLLYTTATSTPVYIYSAEGKHITHFGVHGSGDSKLNSPGAIAVDSKGRIYVSDSNAVKVFDQDGKYVGLIRMPFSYPANGLAFDKSDRLYVVARNEKKVYRFVLNAP
ncbi:MAG: NHL repeat-containing protein [Chloroflexia bacterium]